MIEGNVKQEWRVVQNAILVMKLMSTFIYVLTEATAICHLLGRFERRWDYSYPPSHQQNIFWVQQRKKNETV